MVVHVFFCENVHCMVLSVYYYSRIQQFSRSSTRWNLVCMTSRSSSLFAWFLFVGAALSFTTMFSVSFIIYVEFGMHIAGRIIVYWMVPVDVSTACSTSSSFSCTYTCFLNSLMLSLRSTHTFYQDYDLVEQSFVVFYLLYVSGVLPVWFGHGGRRGAGSRN